jgi:hypothetical protein
MTRLRAPRLVGLVLSLGLTACSDGGGDSRALESWAEGVAAIPISSEPTTPDARPERSRLVVEVVERWRLPSDTAGLRTLTGLAVPIEVMLPADAPLVTETPSRPTVVQLAAFRSESDAAEAWARLVAGNSDLFSRVEPRFETVELPSGVWVRLKAEAPDPASVPALCRAAGAEDRWCAKAAS